MKPLFTDRTAGGFLEEVHKQRTELRKTAEYVVSDGGLIDQYYEETKLSAENDHVINPDEEDTSPEYSYQEKTETLKTWLKNRLAWLDANINSIDDMVHTITYVIGREPALSKVDEYSYESENYDIADVDFYGVVKALAEGTVRIHVQSSTYTEEDPHICETWVTIIVSDTPFVPEYTVVSADQTVWQKGTEEDITLTVKRNEEDETCFSHFKGVLMDEKELIRDTDYTAVSGSTVITNNAATLDVLSEGEHTVTAVFDDGKAETKLTIETAETPEPSPEPTMTPSTSPEPSGTPSTGDTSNPALWTGLIAGSAAVIVICLILRNKLMK
ncbi:MAG TPA: hypothetical protein DHW39_02310 [Erysipelotrichaceae bacterium]|nr:hypothetical protein [Erysipelotrichaceae bacterium]